MLKFLPVGAVLATILSSGITSSLLASPLRAANERERASPSLLVADSSTSTPGGSDKIGGVGTIFGIAAVGAGSAAIVWSAKRANNSLKLDSHSIEQASPQLRKKLLSLLHNDYNAANRLLAQVQMSYPDKSVNWSIEKVIYDLERDRGR